MIISAYTLLVTFVGGTLEWLLAPKDFASFGTALWWAIQTVTTVGYGDVVPASSPGKVVGAFLMLGGLSLYAVITGAITSAFVAEAQARGRLGSDPVLERLDEVTAQLDALKAELTRRDPPRD